MSLVLLDNSVVNIVLEMLQKGQGVLEESTGVLEEGEEVLEESIGVLEEGEGVLGESINSCLRRVRECWGEYR